MEFGSVSHYDAEHFLTDLDNIKKLFISCIYGNYLAEGTRNLTRRWEKVLIRCADVFTYDQLWYSVDRFITTYISVLIDYERTSLRFDSEETSESFVHCYSQTAN